MEIWVPSVNEIDVPRTNRSIEPYLFEEYKNLPDQSIYSRTMHEVQETRFEIVTNY